MAEHAGDPAPLDKESMRRQGRTIRELFGPLAARYDLQNRLFSLWLDVLWRKRLVERVRLLPSGSTGRVLDLAAGTLDVSLALHRRFPQTAILALDLSKPMLEWGMRHKVPDPACAFIRPLTGDARALPLRDNSVDAVTVAFGIRNMQPRGAALAEIRRVLAPGGSLHVLEFAPVTAPLIGPVYHWYLERVMPVFAGLISGEADAFRYLCASIRDFPPPPVFARELEAAGFRPQAWDALSFGIVNIHRAAKPA